MNVTTSGGRRLVRAAGLGLILAAGCALAGCGEAGSKNSVASGGSPRAGASAQATAPATPDLKKWTKCLRDNGIDVKDPDPATGAVDLPSEDSPALTAAMDKCKQFEGGNRGSTGLNPNDPAQEEYRLKFAKCMREKGVDWPDPQPGGAPMKVPPLTPELRDALNKCSQEVPGGPK